MFYICGQNVIKTRVTIFLLKLTVDITVESVNYPLHLFCFWYEKLYKSCFKSVNCCRFYLIEFFKVIINIFFPLMATLRIKQIFLEVITQQTNLNFNEAKNDLRNKTCEVQCCLSYVNFHI